MPDAGTEVPDWLVPAAIVFGVAALVAAVLVWVMRAARRSPRAQAAAEAARVRAGSALVRLDDAVDELDLEVGLSGALYGGQSSTALRRARMTAQHVRDDAFSQYQSLSHPGIIPRDAQRRAARIETRAAAAVTAIGRARAEHGAWAAVHAPGPQQVTAARRRLAELRDTLGDPAALVGELSARFDAPEWQDAASAAASATDAADEAERRLDAAAAPAADPSPTALPDLVAAERALRRAQADARILEETHRTAVQSAEALAGEFDAAHGALRQALTARRHLPPDAAERLADEVRAVEASLASLRPDAARRPTATVAAIARLRDRLDLALGDSRTAQERVRGARTALPGTLAAARGAVGHAEASVAAVRTGADARAGLAAAQRELASARTSPDPVAALDAARRALAHAEHAKALADHDRLSAG